MKPPPPESRAHLENLFGAFDPYPKALEVRHATFQNDEFIHWLDDHQVSWVNVDQPLFHESVKPADTATGPVAYVRLHGRNYEKWFAHAESWERYNYLYSTDELAPWIEATPAGADEFSGLATRRTGALLARSVASRELIAHVTFGVSA